MCELCIWSGGTSGRLVALAARGHPCSYLQRAPPSGSPPEGPGLCRGRQPQVVLLTGLTTTLPVFRGYSSQSEEIIEPSEDSFETMMERKNPSSKQMESSEGSSNTTVEMSSSQVQEAMGPASGAAQEVRELASGPLQESAALPTDLLQAMEEPSSGPRQEIEDPPNDLLQDMEESHNGSRQEEGGPSSEGAGKMEKKSVNPREVPKKQGSDTDLSDSSEDEDSGERMRRNVLQEQELVTVRCVTSLYYRIQDLREEQRLEEQLLLQGICTGRLPVPVPFGGDRRQYREFLVLCQLIVEHYPRIFANDSLRVGYIITHLSGMALEWAKTLLQANSPLLRNLSSFLGAMSKMFEYRQVLRMAEEAMLTIRQRNRPLSVYITEFQGLVSILRWPDEVLQAHLCQGLNEEIRHYLFRIPQPDSLESLIVLVLQIEEKLAERRAVLRLPPESRPRNLTWIDSPAPERWMVSSWLPREVHPAIERAHLFLLLLVRVSPYHSVAVRALLDSGASANFMDEKFAQEHYVELHEKPYPQHIRSADGSLVGGEPVWLYTEPLLCIHQNHHEYLEFDILPSPSFSVVLGITWLRKHAPEVDWARGRCSFHSPYCLLNCFRPPPPCIALDRQGLSLLPGLPPPYSDLADVFNPREADDETSDQPSSDGSDDLSESEPSELQQAGDSDHDEIGDERPSTAPPWEPMWTGVQGSARPHSAQRDARGMRSDTQDHIQMIPELFDQLHGATWFTKLVLRGTIVERMEEHQTEAMWRVAFGLEGQERARFCPFRISANPVLPQSMIQFVLKDILGYFVLSYGNEVVIYSMSRQEHPEHVRQVLVRFRRFCIYCSLDQSQFHRNTVEFLGFVISPKGVKLHKNVVATVAGYPTPRSQRSLGQLMEFIFPYRHFVERFTALTEPLQRLLRPRRAFSWAEEQQEAFERLKRAFRKAPRLHHPKPQNPFFLETGITETSLHATLIQVDEQTGKKVYCAFYSRNTQTDEDNYPQLQRRILPIRASFMVWRRYLENTEEPIMILLNTEDLASLNNDRLAVLLPGQWVFFFSHFNFDVMEWPPREGQESRLPLRGQRADTVDPEMTTQPLLLFPTDSFPFGPTTTQEGENTAQQEPPSAENILALLPIDQIINIFLVHLGAVQMKAVVLHFLRSLMLWKNNLALAATLVLLHLRPRAQRLLTQTPLVAQPRLRHPQCLTLDSSIITHYSLANSIAQLLIQRPPLMGANAMRGRELAQLFLSPDNWQDYVPIPESYRGLQWSPNFWLMLCEFFGVRVTPGEDRHPLPRHHRCLEVHVVSDDNVVLRDAQQGDLQRYRQGGLHDGLQDTPQDDQEHAAREDPQRAAAALAVPLHSQAHPAVLAFLRNTRTEGRPALLSGRMVARLLVRFLSMRRSQPTPSAVQESPPRGAEPSLEESSDSDDGANN
ncbi:PREDICTED: retrotransposon-like protein 1 [Elephantulus edwardii]|uniref:retrotransposon-like protein 1 n=1 Tax=Elephantulus edwardii TaxID=28737 RepID=UPI0003F08517|nr:PREDICTED: retrotransposon-like protein 1 [Elephantulus edwardii]